MSDRKVSIIVPVFNAERFLERCIESLLAQSYGNLEIVLVDDGSTDASLAICRKFEKTDCRVHVYTQKNLGPSAARNLGLEKSHGQFVFFCDSDDYIDDDVIKKLVLNYDRQFLTGVFHRIKKDSTILDKTYKKSQYTRDELFKEIFRGNVLGRVACYLFSRERIGDIRFDEGTNCMEDTVFLTIYLKRNEINSIRFVSGTYYYYVDNDSSITRDSENCIERIESFSYSLNRINELTEGKFTSLIENDKIKIAENTLRRVPDSRSLVRLQKCLKEYRGPVVRYRLFSFLIKSGNMGGIRIYFHCKNLLKSFLKKPALACESREKRVAIITIIDNRNIGNRLQNLATQKFLNEHLGVRAITVRNSNRDGRNETLRKRLKNALLDLRFYSRTTSFRRFNKNIDMTHGNYDSSEDNSSLDKIYDYFVVGSDQVWNPNYGWLNSIDLLSFAADEKRISFSASFGISKIPEVYVGIIKRELPKFKAISVREERGRDIITEAIGRKDVEVLVDPTMLFSMNEWSTYERRPKWLVADKPILLKYFLGGTSVKSNEAIEKVAKEYDCQIVDIFDRKSISYSCGPSEFLWLERNAFLICTDSFHSSVFAIINQRPFVVFERIDKDGKMSSRIETLVRKFELKDRLFNGRSITDKNLKVDYAGVEGILEKERRKSLKFLKDALGVKDEGR